MKTKRIKRVTIRFLKTGHVTWADRYGENEKREFVKQGDLQEGVVIQPSQSGVDNEFDVYGRNLWSITLAQDAFEVVKSTVRK